MITTKNTKSFKFILGITGIIIASCAAYFSIFGLSKLFSSSQLEVIIMASALELGKLIAVSFLYRYWIEISKSLKTYLFIAIFGLMIITSLGIYGFLTSSYQNTVNKMTVNNSEVSLIENKKQTFESKIKALVNDLENTNTRLNNLVILRGTQEDRIDKLLEGENYYTVRKVQDDIKRADIEIDKLNKKIDKTNEEIFSYRDSISVYDLQILNAKDLDVAGELGPLIYISELTDTDMNVIINYLVLLIVFVFDPLAISLVVGYNFLQNETKDDNVEEKEQLKRNYVPIINNEDKNDKEIKKDETNSFSEGETDISKNQKIEYNEKNDVLIFDDEPIIEDTDIEEEENTEEISKDVFDEFERNMEIEDKFYNNDDKSKNKKTIYGNSTKLK